MPKRECVWDAPENDPKVDSNRPLRMDRPCDCGTCSATTVGVGYITGSIDGEGVTIWIKSEKAYQRMAKLLRKNGLFAE